MRPKSDVSCVESVWPLRCACAQGEDNDNGSGEAAAISLESEGEIVDDPEADLMLLLVDHKSKDKMHIKFKSRHEKEDWLELLVNAKEEMGAFLSISPLFKFKFFVFLVLLMSEFLFRSRQPSWGWRDPRT